MVGRGIGRGAKLNKDEQEANSTTTKKYANVEQKTRSFLENLKKQGGPPIYTLSPKAARTVLSDLQASVPVEKLPAAIENRSIPGGPTASVSITIVRPQGSSDTLPVVMY